MYRPDEMAIVLDAAKQYTDGQRLAHTEIVKKAITWDGDLTGKESIGVWIRISDTPISVTPESFSRVVITNGANKMIYDAATIDVSSTETIVLVEVSPGGKMPAVLIVVGDETMPDGVYFIELEAGYWVSLLETKEATIHPIPQEYIPPLDRLVLNGADGNQYALTITDGAISVAPVTT